MKDKICAICCKILTSADTVVIGKYDLCRNHGQQLNLQIEVFAEEQINLMSDIEKNNTRSPLDDKD